MSEESKKKDHLNTCRIIQDIFKNNWKEIFLLDSINKQTITYEEFFSMILDYKEKLQQSGIKKNDTICFLMQNSLELIILYFASLVLQLKIVPIEPEKGEIEIKEILSYLDYKALITNSDFNYIENKISINEFRGIKKHEINLEQLQIFEKINYDSAFLISFTSGSTGNVKGVIHSFNNLLNSARILNTKFNFNKKNVFYHNLPMSYMAGILNLIILPFVASSKIVIGERFRLFTINNFWNLPIQYGVNTFWFVPTTLELLLKLDRGVDGINYAKSTNLIGCVGTAPLNYQTKIEFEKKYNITLYESYGLSETLFVTTNSLNKEKNHTVGFPLESVSLSLRYDGELAIYVPWMFLDYLNLTKKRFFTDNKFLSGDIAKIDSEGYVSITGRKKDLIIKGGINISPKKIEDFINQFGSFENNIIMGFPNRLLGEKTVCFFVPKNNLDTEKEKKKINFLLTKKLGKEYHIDEFIELKEIPRNINGKIDKPKIRAQYELNTDDT